MVSIDMEEAITQSVNNYAIRCTESISANPLHSLLLLTGINHGPTTQEDRSLKREGDLFNGALEI